MPSPGLLRRLGVAFCVVALPIWALPAQAYREEVHQQITFMAARQFNRCVDGQQVPRLSALQVRNLVRGNLEEDDLGFFHRSIRWSYYDRRNQDPGRWAWFVETRLHGRYRWLAGVALATVPEAELDRYRALGGVIHYLQQVTIPANVVPIVHPRWWRWPAGDRFTNYPLDQEALTASLEQVCAEVLATPVDTGFDELLDRGAAATMAAIREPIADMDTTWQAFWREDDPGEFGSYGEAGNSFGRRAEFDCGDVECLLLEGDPIYRDFALRQHRLAVVGTMRAILQLQRAAVRGRLAGELGWD